MTSVTAARRGRPPGDRHNGSMHAAALRIDLHLPSCRSLKEKRAVLRPVVEGIRHRFRLSVAEVDHHDRWQRAAIGVAAVAESEGRLREVLDAVERFVVAAADVEVVDVEELVLAVPDPVLEWDA